MAHLLESMMYLGDKPWHGLGMELDHPPTAEEAIIASGLNWDVALTYLTAGDNHIEIPDHWAVVRETDSRVLGVVGKKYVPLQNRDAFKWFDPIIANGKATYHTAGSLRGGALVWVLAKLSTSLKVGSDDIVDKYLLLTTGHDGLRCVSALTTPVRVVCWNTLSAALRGGGQDAIRVLHTQSMETNLNRAQKVLGMVDAQYEKLGEAFSVMARKMVKRQQVEAFVETLFPIDEDAKVTTRTENIRSNVINLFETGKGQNYEAARGTVWGLYNAVTEFVDHVRGTQEDGVGRSVAARRADKRLESVWLGAGAEIKRVAFQQALALAA